MRFWSRRDRLRLPGVVHRVDRDRNDAVRKIRIGFVSRDHRFPGLANVRIGDGEFRLVIGFVAEVFVQPSGRVNVQFLKRSPEFGQRAGLIDIERRLSNAEELPAASLEVSLPCQIAFVGFGAVPVVSVAFDGEARLRPKDDQVEVVAVRRVLRDDGVSAIDQSVVDALLKQ